MQDGSPFGEAVKLILAGDKFALIWLASLEITKGCLHGIFGAWRRQVRVRCAELVIDFLELANPFAPVQRLKERP